MKFVGTIKGKPYLIDPETFEAEIREKIVARLQEELLHPCGLAECGCQLRRVGLELAMSIIKEDS